MTLFGILISVTTLLLWAIDLNLLRFIATHFQTHPMAFATYNLIASSVVLILIAGPGKGGIDVLRTPHTWAYGFFQVLLNITDMAVLFFLAATELQFLASSSVPMALAMSWIFLRRAPLKSDYIGSFFVLVGVVYIIQNLDESTRLVATTLALLATFFYTCRTIVSELHPQSISALTIKQRCRVTGYVLMVTSLVLLGCLALFSAFAQEEVIKALHIVPTLDDIFDIETILSAIIMGVTILAPAMYFFFWSAVLVKTENFLVIGVGIMPLSYVVEWIFSKFGLLDITSLTQEDLIAGIIITLASLYMVYMRQKAERS